MEDNVTWDMEELPSTYEALDCKWVYWVEYHSNGYVERLKARLIVFCNHQVECIDYNETFALVANMVTVRAFLVVVAAKN